MLPWHALNKKVQQWRRLSQDDRQFMQKMLILLPTTKLALTLLGLEKLLHLAQPLPSNKSVNDAEVWEKSLRYARLTQIAAKQCLPAGSCLPQALALCWYLHKQGINAMLKIGVHSNLARFSAHAWVEVNGRSLDQAPTTFHAFNYALNQINNARAPHDISPI